MTGLIALAAVVFLPGALEVLTRRHPSTTGRHRAGDRR